MVANQRRAAVIDNLNRNHHPRRAMKGRTKDFMATDNMCYGGFKYLQAEISFDQDGALSAIRCMAINVLQHPEISLLRRTSKPLDDTVAHYLHLRFLSAAL